MFYGSSSGEWDAFIDQEDNLPRKNEEGVDIFSDVWRNHTGGRDIPLWTNDDLPYSGNH